MSDVSRQEWNDFHTSVIECRRCQRLVEHRECIAREKRAAFRDEEYWGRPVPGFGDRQAMLLIVRLAPAAHGVRGGKGVAKSSSSKGLSRACGRSRAHDQIRAYSHIRAHSHIRVYDQIRAHGRFAEPSATGPLKTSRA